ncbi:MAG: hypothetical protein JWN56_1382 [Sphingobacteriales bacterium]|nr:hypothetical protein [Sphingobacteriales bacterium]
MWKRINWKAVLFTVIWVVSLSGLGVLMGFIEQKKVAVICRDVRVLIPGTQSFIERKEIDEILLQNKGPLIGRKLNLINIHDIENELKANPFIEYAKVYADMDGIITVRIKQREPVLRILNSENQDFYVDLNGLKIPTSENFTAEVLVANGLISEHFSNKVDTLKTQLAKDLFNTALFIRKDTLWNNQIEQIYVNSKKEIELVPRVGNQKIILGSADSLDVKFRNLLAFYKKALPKVGWDTYKTINVKYANQIVCEKTKVDSIKAIKANPNLQVIIADSLKIDNTDTTKIQ